MSLGKIANISIASIGKVAGVSRVNRKEINASSLVSDASLKAYYRLNSGALTTDSKSGYTLTNMNSAGEGAGLWAGSLDLGASNTNKYLYRDTDFGVTAVTAITLSLWILAQNHPGSGAAWDLAVRNCGTSGYNTNYVVRYANSGGTYYVQFIREKVGSTVTVLSVPFDLGTSAWHHLVLTWDGSTLKGYINGALKDSVAASGAPSGSSVSMFAIGTSRTRNTSFASAQFDDVAYFTKALSEAEIGLLNFNYKSIAGVG